MPVVLLGCNNEWMNRPTNGWMDQGDSVPLVHVAAFDWPSLTSSPPPASGRRSVIDGQGDVWTERHTATDGVAVWSFKAIRPCDLAQVTSLRVVSGICSYRHSAGWMQRPRPRLPDGSLRSRAFVVVFGRYTDLLSADMGVRIIRYIGLQIFYTVTKI